MRQVETFPDGAVLFDNCNQVRVRGRRQQAPGVALLERAEPQLGQDEMPGVEAHQCRAGTMFEGPHKPELTEAQKTLAKKREELGRVLEQLRSPGLPGHGE